MPKLKVSFAGISQKGRVVVNCTCKKTLELQAKSL